MLESGGCELLSDFVYSFFEHNVLSSELARDWLWIAFRFCIFVLWTQFDRGGKYAECCCELLSDFVYSFFEHNLVDLDERHKKVVNCFQILYIRSLNTMFGSLKAVSVGCELLSDFVYSFFEHNCRRKKSRLMPLWIAFRFCIFVLWTQLSFQVYATAIVVNCFQILYIRSLNTIILFGSIDRIKLWIAFRFCIFVLWTQWSFFQRTGRHCCELLSDFVYSFFEHNVGRI